MATMTRVNEQLRERCRDAEEKFDYWRGCSKRVAKECQDWKRMYHEAVAIADGWKKRVIENELAEPQLRVYRNWIVTLANSISDLHGDMLIDNQDLLQSLKDLAAGITPSQLADNSAYHDKKPRKRRGFK